MKRMDYFYLITTRAKPLLKDALFLYLGNARVLLAIVHTRQFSPKLIYYLNNNNQNNYESLLKWITRGHQFKLCRYLQNILR